MERTFYKILIVGLVLTTALKAMLLIIGIITVVGSQDLWRMKPFDDYLSQYGFYTFERLLYGIGSFILWLSATYWLPKTIKKLFPEVS